MDRVLSAVEELFEEPLEANNFVGPKSIFYTVQFNSNFLFYDVIQLCAFENY